MTKLTKRTIWVVMIAAAAGFVMSPEAIANTETLRPTGAGNSANNSPIGATDNWDCVEEVTSDGVTTYVQNTATGYLTDTYATADSSNSGTINSVTIYISSYGTGGGGGGSKARTVVRTYSTDYVGSANTMTASFATYSTSYSTNPNTSSAWTWTEVNGMEIGVSQQGVTGFSTVRTTQVWAVVDYTPSASPLTLKGSGLQLKGSALQIEGGT